MTGAAADDALTSAAAAPAWVAATRARFAAARAWMERPVPSLLALALLSRVGFILVAALAGSYFPAGVEHPWNRGPGFVRYFARWDSGFYMDIAELGYGFKPEAWSFNPGYPLAIAAVKLALPFLDWPTAGFLVSNAAFLGCVALLYLLTREVFDERVAWRAAAFLAFVPGSFYLGAVYADAVFLLLLLGFFLALAKERWLLAGGLVGLASVTRPPGLFLLGAMGLALLMTLARTRRVPWRGVAGGALALVPPGLFLLYSYAKTGDAFISARSREVYWPNVEWHDPRTLLSFSGVPWAIEFLVWIGLGLLLAAVLFMAHDLAVHRRWKALPLYAWSAVMALIYLAYSEPNPILRYLLSFVPLYWLLARVSASPAVFAGLAAVCSALAALVAAIFAAWGPLY